MADRELCQAAYREMYRAMIAKDIPALSQVLDDSFVLVHMTGMRQPKAAFLKAVANGTLNYSSAEHDSMDVTVRENTATLIGKSRVHAAVFGGGWHTCPRTIQTIENGCLYTFIYDYGFYKYHFTAHFASFDTLDTLQFLVSPRKAPPERGLCSWKCTCGR